jgi:bisphosphoglycerate-independent phosphoglycerate mutase (AlkP superfamily)
VVDRQVALTDIAPTVLAHVGVPQPSHMRGRALGLDRTAWSGR